jgi:hypothetical protein
LTFVNLFYIAKALQKATGIEEASSGSYLVNYSKEHSLPMDRRSLQDLGSQFIEESPEAFLAGATVNGFRRLSCCTGIPWVSRYLAMFWLLFSLISFLYIREKIP